MSQEPLSSSSSSLSMSNAAYQPLTRPRTSLRDRIGAYLGLAVVDLILKTAGYKSLRRRLVNCPTAPNGRTTTDNVQSQVVAAVDWAIVYYPHPVLCLQRSSVITWLLRKRGVSAQMVIGCQHVPVKAHAWVEVDHVVVSDRNSVVSLYFEMERV